MTTRLHYEKHTVACHRKVLVMLVLASLIRYITNGLDMADDNDDYITYDYNWAFSALLLYTYYLLIEFAFSSAAWLLTDFFYIRSGLGRSQIRLLSPNIFFINPNPGSPSLFDSSKRPFSQLCSWHSHPLVLTAQNTWYDPARTSNSRRMDETAVKTHSGRYLNTKNDSNTKFRPLRGTRVAGSKFRPSFPYTGIQGARK